MQPRVDIDLVQSRRTDRARWEDEAQLDPAWNARAVLAATFIGCGARVLDIGCGRGALEQYLPSFCEYVPCDLVARDQRTVVCDLNAHEFPVQEAAQADIIALLGVLEYIADPDWLFRQLALHRASVVVSYCVRELSGSIDRSTLGWFTSFSIDDLANLAARHGFELVASEQIDALQILCKLERRPRVAARAQRVAIVSFSDIGNFGDRLGFHIINALLPAHCTTHHLTFRTLDAAAESYDLVVLGTGNSLFAPLLTDALSAVLDRAKAVMGIFGTQYRRELPSRRLAPVLDRLTMWHARTEEDVAIYGRGRSNVRHLGDWLTNQFPICEPSDPGLLQIGDEVLAELPLDRTIQRIQRYSLVHSSRVHPLLCALSSARAVAYAEQYEMGHASGGSGKFRGLCYDVFGRTFPADTFFDVDRAAVIAYRAGVAARTATLASELREALTAVA